MKKSKMMMLVTTLLTTSLFAQKGEPTQPQADTIGVQGNCGMCKRRIEKAAKAPGVTAARWNARTQLLTLSYDAQKQSREAIEKRIAAAGHDTEHQKAHEAAYQDLPGCCQYQRKQEQTTHQH